MEKIINGRKVMLKALTGSHNYNLNTPTSDKDYKYFVMPTLEDLYHGRMTSTSHNSPTLDYTVHDIRKLPDLLFKANLNFIEVLFSQELKFAKPFAFFHANKNAISRMNLPGMWNACIGMHKQKRYGLTKGESPQAKASIEKFGYDVKQLMHSYRVLDFLNRFTLYDDFQTAIYYGSESPTQRESILSLKNSKMTKEQAEEFLDEHLALTENNERVKSYYLDSKPNQELYDYLQDRTYREIKLMLGREEDGEV